MFWVQRAYRPVHGNNQLLPKKISFRLKLDKVVGWSLIDQGLKHPRYIHWYLCTDHFWIHIRRGMSHIWSYLQYWHRLLKLFQGSVDSLNPQTEQGWCQSGPDSGVRVRMIPDLDSCGRQRWWYHQRRNHNRGIRHHKWWLYLYRTYIAPIRLSTVISRVI